MPIVTMLRFTLAAIVALLGLSQVAAMFSAELNSDYTGWSLAAGLVFLAVGAAFIIYDGRNDISTEFEDKE